jgi:hypothetical protein
MERAALQGTLREMKEGSVNGASLSMGALRGGPGGSAPLLRTLLKHVMEGSGKGAFLYRTP